MINAENGTRKDSRARGWARNRAADALVSGRLPSYETTTYYGTVLGQVDGEWTLQWKGASRYHNVKTRIDLFGDRIFRKFDYHFVQNPLHLLLRRPGSFVESLRAEPKAKRGTAGEVWDETVRLGLDTVYQPHTKNGEVIGIKIDRDLAEKAPTLWDIIAAHRGDLDAQDLKQVDRFDAYTRAGQYKSQVDSSVGYSNIDGPWEVFFRKIVDGKVEDPIANVPDIIANRSKVRSNDYHALTLAMLMTNVVVEELKIPDGDPQRAAQALVDGYDDPKIAQMVARYMRVGRLTFPGEKPSQFSQTRTMPPLRDLRKNVGMTTALRMKAANSLSPDNIFNRAARGMGSVHNKGAMRVNSEDALQIRETIINANERYLKNKTVATEETS